MKAVTEFPSFNLTKALAAKAALTSEGKSAEEIQTSLGQTFKLEGDKLKYFINALDVAGQKTDGLKRVVVMSINEGENPPARGTKVEELYYVPEFFVTSAPAPADHKKGGGHQKRGGKKDGPKGSPWGLSPEEKAAKNAKGGAKPPKPS
jgi:hypothetical protein